MSGAVFWKTWEVLHLWFSTLVRVFRLELSLPFQRREWMLLLLCTAASLLLWRLAPRRAFLSRRFRRFSRRSFAAPFAVFVFALVLWIAFRPFHDAFTPQCQDEYSYLLGADTFAHGRFTNPTPPFANHFESFHVLVHPTYASMYPPAQAALMALGQVTLRSPAAAVVLSAALLCALITWALRAWMAPQWALLAGIIAVFRIDLLSYWGNSYWGGAVAGIGGCLVYGAVGRMRAAVAWRDQFLLAAGLLLLANSRPYEGLVFSIPAMVLGARFASRHHQLWKPIVTALLLIVVGAPLLMSYCKAVTGNSFTLPWTLQRRQYATVPPFTLQSLSSRKSYNAPEMAELYQAAELRDWWTSQTFGGFGVRLVEKVDQNWRFFLGPAFTFLVFAFVAAFRRSRTTFFALALAFALPFLAFETWLQPHYLAPAIVIIYGLIASGLQRLVTWGRTSRLGVTLARATLFAAVAGVPAMLLTSFHERTFHPTWSLCLPSHPDWARIHSDLARFPGRHLVIVTYREPHDSFVHWIWNGADVSSEKVIWARSLGPERDHDLICHSLDRTIWRFTPPERLSPTLIPIDPQLQLFDRSSIDCSHPVQPPPLVTRYPLAGGFPPGDSIQQADR